MAGVHDWSRPLRKTKLKKVKQVDAYANEFSLAEKITIEGFLMKKKDKIKTEKLV